MKVNSKVGLDYDNESRPIFVSNVISCIILLDINAFLWFCENFVKFFIIFAPDKVNKVLFSSKITPMRPGLGGATRGRKEKTSFATFFILFFY